MDIDFYNAEFKTKCNSKNLNAVDFHKKMTERIPQYKARWKNSLQDQIKELPDFEQVEREVNRHLKKLKI